MRYSEPGHRAVVAIIAPPTCRADAKQRWELLRRRTGRVAELGPLGRFTRYGMAS
jgi:hypothetical protein